MVGNMEHLRRRHSLKVNTPNPKMTLYAKKMNATMPHSRGIEPVGCLAKTTRNGTNSSGPACSYEDFYYLKKNERLDTELQEDDNKPVVAKRESDDKRRKLLFLLEVASNPDISGSDNISSHPSPEASISLFPQYRSSCTQEIKCEEDYYNNRRIQYSLSTYNSGQGIQQAVTEAKAMRAKSSTVSLVSTSERPSSLLSPNIAGTKKSTHIISDSATDCSFLPRPKAQPKPQPPRRRHDQKRTFPEKLLDVLSRKDCESAITWLPYGNSFVIVSPKKFVIDVLPKYFKEAKFESFTRKLTRWGYKRITKEKNTVAYTHKFFRRDCPELCKMMSSGRKENPHQLMSTVAGHSSLKPFFPTPTPAPARSPMLDDYIRYALNGSDTAECNTRCDKNGLSYTTKVSNKNFLWSPSTFPDKPNSIGAGHQKGLYPSEKLLGKIHCHHSFGEIPKRNGIISTPSSSLLFLKGLLVPGTMERSLINGITDTQLKPNAALTMFYNRKMREITTLYSGHLASKRRGPVTPKPLATLLYKSTCSNIQQHGEKHLSYFHHSRQSKISQQQDLHYRQGIPQQRSFSPSSA